jgi:hypothetical protein
MPPRGATRGPAPSGLHPGGGAAIIRRRRPVVSDDREAWHCNRELLTIRAPKRLAGVTGAFDKRDQGVLMNLLNLTDSFIEEEILVPTLKHSRDNDEDEDLEDEDFDSDDEEFDPELDEMDEDDDEFLDDDEEEDA